MTETSPLRRKMDRAIKIARTMKEVKVADVRRRSPRRLWETDIHPLIEGWRGEEPVVGMITEQIDRDQALLSARHLIKGFGLDTVVLVTEGWHPVGEYNEANPMTGKRWAPGEMQDAAEHHDALGRGWLMEAINVIAVNRAGDMALRVQDYTITQREGPTRVELAWGESLDSDEGDAVAGGHVPSSLARYMNETPMDVLAARAGLDPAEFGLTDPEEIRAHLDCATVRVMSAAGAFGGVMLLAVPGSVRSKIINDSLGQHPDRIWDVDLGPDDPEQEAP